MTLKRYKQTLLFPLHEKAQQQEQQKKKVLDGRKSRIASKASTLENFAVQHETVVMHHAVTKDVQAEFFHASVILDPHRFESEEIKDFSTLDSESQESTRKYDVFRSKFEFYYFATHKMNPNVNQLLTEKIDKEWETLQFDDDQTYQARLDSLEVVVDNRKRKNKIKKSHQLEIKLESVKPQIQIITRPKKLEMHSTYKIMRLQHI